MAGDLSLLCAVYIKVYISRFEANGMCDFPKANYVASKFRVYGSLSPSMMKLATPVFWLRGGVVEFYDTQVRRMGSVHQPDTRW